MYYDITRYNLHSEIHNGSIVEKVTGGKSNLVHICVNMGVKEPISKDGYLITYVLNFNGIETLLTFTDCKSIVNPNLLFEICRIVSFPSSDVQYVPRYFIICTFNLIFTIYPI